MPKVKTASDGVVIAEIDLFRVIHLTERSSREWKSLKVVRDVPAGMGGIRSWRFGWNGERFSRNTALAQLDRDHPEFVSALRKALGA
jgi:hypothetical protein